MNEAIKKLQEQIKEEERKMRNCHHDFDSSFFDPETVREAYGYKDVKKDRWARKCKKCGFTEYTYSTKPIIKGYEPNFKS